MCLMSWPSSPPPSPHFLRSGTVNLQFLHEMTTTGTDHDHMHVLWTCTPTMSSMKAKISNEIMVQKTLNIKLSLHNVTERQSQSALRLHCQRHHLHEKAFNFFIPSESIVTFQTNRARTSIGLRVEHRQKCNTEFHVTSSLLPWE